MTKAVDNGKEEYDMTYRDGHDCILVHRKLDVEDLKRYAPTTRRIRRRYSWRKVSPQRAQPFKHLEEITENVVNDH